jgi:osmotically-inducible protein OsmY
MPDPAVDPQLADRLARQLAASDLPVVVEASDGALVVSGVVPTEEARQAVLDIIATAAPDARVDDQIDVEAVLPPDIDRFASAEVSTEPPRSRREIRAQDEELDPDFTDQPVLRDPVAASGPTSGEEDQVESGDEVYTPPDDPVLTTDAHGQPRVLGGFGEDDEVTVERSALDGQRGDEAIADAIRQELNEDAATADLVIVVAVRNGVAHLRGRVEDLEDAENAEAVAARVPGVREVVEELEVANV